MIHKTTRSILSVLLAALLLVTSTPLTPAFAGERGAVSLQSESGESEGLAGTSTRGDPYQIATADDLLEFAKLVNGGETTADAVLTDDIDLNNQPWYPIGRDSRPYSGTFDGDGHTISGLYIDSSDTDYQGLFGFVDSEGTVQNLSVSGSVSGSYVGGVVGLNSGSVENCYNTGEVSGNYVGGVVGQNSGSVKNCYNTGEVSGKISVGSFVGENRNSASVINCYFLQTANVNKDLRGIGENVGSGDATATAKDGTAFHSGEVAWWL